MLALNAFDPASRRGIDPTVHGLIERRSKVFGSAVPLFYEEPVHIVRANGVWLYDHEGREYLDAYNNVPSVGHCHPHVVDAIARQAACLNTHTRYLSEVVYAYAERLLGTFPEPLSQVLFTSSGTESVDLAMRIARYHTGGTGFIVTRFAYHGHSTAVAEITPAFGPGVPLGEHVRTVPAPDGYRGAPDVAAAFASHVEQAIADMARHGIRFAGMIADSVFSSDGLFPDPPGFLQAAVDVVTRAGGVYIADEVQPGFGRTGAGMWGFGRHGITPDLVVMGKPMGNGMPIAAVVARPDVLASFASRSGYFNTFGGNTVCCAAAAAVLDVIENERLIERAARVGRYLKEGFERLKGAYRSIGDVRGAGLYVAVECVDPQRGGAPDAAEALRIVNGLRRRRILISTCGASGNVLKIRPPLPFSAEHCDLLLLATEALLADR
ncbi:aspartate aminotransferase family protein [Burkholderia sp. Ac-20353]|nr:aspartate aminotransferase family protein [Burkholderia sp. Ac-20353]MBN3786934.1 aspartate aminotransferase family protein [Burkholderia sp. Ac-20353]